MSEKYNQILVEMMLLVPKVNFMEIKERRCGKLRFPIYLSESILNTKIDELELSVRSGNCLHRAGYQTIGQLVGAINGSEDLRKIRNCGRKSVDEIMQQLFCYQYRQLDATERIRYIHRIIELN